MKKQVVAAMLAVSLSMSVNTPAWAAQVENNAGQVEEKETNEEIEKTKDNEKQQKNDTENININDDVE